jgi:hypothetical protein
MSVIDTAFSPVFAGAPMTDFATASDRFGGPHHRGWTHPLQDTPALSGHHSHDVALGAWAKQVHPDYKRAAPLALAWRAGTLAAGARPGLLPACHLYQRT